MKIGALFAGMGGLEIGVQAAIGGDIAWHSDIDPGACKILAHRYPGVPNLGDITAVDWSQVEPVDVLTGGFPCQDVSTAGKRAGMTPTSRSGLWTHMAHAVSQLRPSMVVIENVRGLLSAEAHSDLEPCPWCLGEAEQRGPALRALGAVLGDLAVLGYDCRTVGLRAADVGAPHGRFRVFVVAHAQHDGRAADAFRRGVGQGEGPGRVLQPQGSSAVPTLLPTPAAYDADRGGPQHADKRRAGGHSVSLQDAVHGLTLLPTPAVNDMGEGKTPEAWDEWTAKMKAAHANGNGHGKSLAIEAQRLLPTPTAGNAADGADPEAWEKARLLLKEKGYNGNGRGTPLGIAVQLEWGAYADAIARWEHVLGRPAPPPTQPSRKGTPQLSARFSEFLMGLPDGWVTDVPGITRNETLRALGNGVVWQQAAAALRYLLGLGDGPPAGAGAALLPTPRALDATDVRGRTPNRTAEANYRADRTLTDEVRQLAGGDDA